MSESGIPEAARESGSSVKLSTNAKGDVQIEIKVRVPDTAEQVAEARRIAQAEFDGLRRAYPRP